MISERALRAALVVLGALNAASGALALIAPDTFFDQIGRYGVENSHYVGDVGAFVLAFGIAVLVAAWRPSWRVPVLALGALWYGLHALNHAFDVGQAPSDGRDPLPLAVLTAFLFMHYVGISSNIMSLGGIAIAIGVLVDAGIVMTENVIRHAENYAQEHGGDR